MTEYRLHRLAATSTDPRRAGLHLEWVFRNRAPIHWLDRRNFYGRNETMETMATKQLDIHAKLADLPKERAATDAVQRARVNHNAVRLWM